MGTLLVSLVLVVKGTFSSFLLTDVSFVEVASKHCYKMKTLNFMSRVRCHQKYVKFNDNNLSNIILIIIKADNNNLSNIRSKQYPFS